MACFKKYKNPVLYFKLDSCQLWFLIGLVIFLAVHLSALQLDCLDPLLEHIQGSQASFGVLCLHHKVLVTILCIPVLHWLGIYPVCSLQKLDTSHV